MQKYSANQVYIELLGEITDVVKNSNHSCFDQLTKVLAHRKCAEKISTLMIEAFIDKNQEYSFKKQKLQSHAFRWNAVAADIATTIADIAADVEIAIELVAVAAVAVIAGAVVTAEGMKIQTDTMLRRPLEDLDNFNPMMQRQIIQLLSQIVTIETLSGISDYIVDKIQYNDFSIKKAS